MGMSADYAAFYKAHKERLFAYLLRMAGSYELAADLMQESFTRYLEHYGAERQDLPLLFTIARNALIDHTRRRRPQAELSENCEDRMPSQETTVIAREEYRKVTAALQQLELDERNILALAVSGDFAYREIAAMNGLSESNVKVKVHRARAKLRALLEG